MKSEVTELPRWEFTPIRKGGQSSISQQASFREESFQVKGSTAEGGLWLPRSDEGCWAPLAGLCAIEGGI